MQSHPPEIAFGTADSPFGPILLAATGDGVVTVGLPGTDHDTLLEGLAAKISPSVAEIPARLDPARRQLGAYFDGELTEFDVPLDWRLSEGFARQALCAVAEIPFGSTASYADIATAAGSPGAHRVAGSACATNPLPILVPCHRVLRSGGDLGGYGGGRSMKRALLSLEQTHAG